MLKEIRFHGRGGQGAVTAATLLAVALFEDGKYSQAFPRFGVERRGAPVEAFTRLSDKFIRRKSQVYEPDILVVLDSTLLDALDITAGLKKGGTVIINTEKKPDVKDATVYTVNATAEAFEVLGRDIVNTAMLGAFAAFTGEVSKEAVFKAIKEHFPPELAEKNVTLVERVYEDSLKSKNG